MESTGEGRWESWITALLGLALAVVGYWGPWVDHAAAALVIPGFDLAEYVKFLPEVRHGSISIVRELFYLPAPAVGLCLALRVGRQRCRLPRWAVGSLTALAAWLALVVAPPVDFIVRFAADPALRQEWGLQATLAGAGFLAVAAAWIWGPRLHRWGAALVATLAAAVGTALPLWQFWAVRPAIDRVYGRPITLGWGLWLMPLGFAALIAAAWWETRQK